MHPSTYMIKYLLCACGENSSDLLSATFKWTIWVISSGCHAQHRTSGLLLLSRKVCTFDLEHPSSPTLPLAATILFSCAYETNCIYLFIFGIHI